MEMTVFFVKSGSTSDHQFFNHLYRDYQNVWRSFPHSFVTIEARQVSRVGRELLALPGHLIFPVFTGFALLDL